MTFGSLGITMYRLLYVINPSFVKYNIGERKLLLFIALGGLTVSAFWSIGYGVGQANTRAAFNICTGRIQIFKKAYQVQCVIINNSALFILVAI